MDNFNTLKRKALEKFFSRMNPEQQRAVFRINGPLLILAGAGSGKTTVLVNRIANMIFFGDAYNNETPMDNIDEADMRFLRDYIDGKENDGKRLSQIVAFRQVKPWNILAITFTNKAAGELKERIGNILGEEGYGQLKATPHKAHLTVLHVICCARRKCPRGIQKLLEIRQYSCVTFVQSDEKI